MRKISGHVVSTKATTLSRAAEIVSRFAAVDNGSSPAVSLYLQRTADAFIDLVHFHDKRSKLRKLQSSPKLETNAAEKILDGDDGKDSEKEVRKKDKKTSNNLKGEEADDVEIPVKKKKRRKTDDGDMKEKMSKKKEEQEQSRCMNNDGDKKEKMSKKKKNKSRADVDS